MRNKGGKGPNKRKVDEQQKNHGINLTNKKKKHQDDNESIASSDEEYAKQNERDDESSNGSDDEQETAQEKKLRLAKKYLEELQEIEKDKAEFDEGAISKRLREEYLEDKGKLRKTIADNYTGYDNFIYLKCKDHKQSITSICISNDGKYLFSGSKDGSIVKWSLNNNTKIKTIFGKSKLPDGIKTVACLAVSTNGKFLVAGDVGSKDIKVFNAETMIFIKNLQGHRGYVTGLVFRKDTLTLYSAADDRSVKVWNLDDMAYVESLFGHNMSITSIDALSRERAITSGGFDGTLRVWKIVEESQLIFNDTGNFIEAVKLINEEYFLSGGDGKLCLWGSMKKKPLCTVLNAHGIDEKNGEPRWITSIATLINTDLVASGSSNGKVKIWKCSDSFRKLNLLFEVDIIGFINSMVFTPDGLNLIVGVGKEPRLARWGPTT